MLLRASGQLSSEEFDIHTVTESNVGDGGVPYGQVLINFAEAVLDNDDELLQRKRDEVVNNLGGEAMVDAAAVIAIFNANDRIANATGIPLDDILAVATVEIRAELGIDSYTSAKND
jgi:hypothetical protein